ncbi:MAG: MATE family efflux transporter [bacterium]|nr:MATE family efflux transporter [bacterium]
MSTTALENANKGSAQASGAGGLREVALLAYPVILNQMSLTAMGVVDTAMVGRLGATELAAVGLGGLWLWTTLSFFLGTSSAVQTFVSQADGAGDRDAPGFWSWQALYSLVPLTLLAISIFYAIAPWLMAQLGPSIGMQEIAVSYMRPRMFGAGAVTATMIMASFFRGLGDTRTPLFATLIANGCNAVLDYGLIFGELGLPEWGAAGAGAATGIAEWIGFAYLLIAFRGKNLCQRHPTHAVGLSVPHVRRLLRTGLPIGGQWVMGMLAFSVFSTVIARMGDVQMAASQAFIVLLSLSFMQAIGISSAASTLVGRYIGAKDFEAARRSFRSAQKLAVLLGGILAVLFVCAPELLLRIFISDTEVLMLGVPLVLLGATFQFFDCFGIVASGSLRGAGDTSWPFWMQAALEWGLFLPIAWLFGIWLDGGLFGAWLGGTIYVIILAGVLVARFLSGAWETIEI